MLGVVIDTNVIVSALLSPGGSPAQVLTLALDGKIEIFYSQEIMAEYQEVLSRSKFGFDGERIFLILEALSDLGVLTTTKISKTPMPDDKDRIFYDTAKAVGVLLVTGNLKHYPVEPFVITPRELLEKI
jgi:putative PIN family toxin of toxin-antitoxin system